MGGSKTHRRSRRTRKSRTFYKHQRSKKKSHSSKSKRVYRAIPVSAGSELKSVFDLDPHLKQLKGMRPRERKLFIEEILDDEVRMRLTKFINVTRPHIKGNRVYLENSEKILARMIDEKGFTLDEALDTLTKKELLTVQKLMHNPKITKEDIMRPSKKPMVDVSKYPTKTRLTSLMPFLRTFKPGEEMTDRDLRIRQRTLRNSTNFVEKTPTEFTRSNPPWWLPPNRLPIPTRLPPPLPIPTPLPTPTRLPPPLPPPTRSPPPTRPNRLLNPTISSDARDAARKEITDGVIQFL